MQTEQGAFAGRFVLRVRVRKIIGHERRSLAKIHPRRIRGNARHEYVMLQIAAACPSRSLDLSWRRAFLPVIRDVEDGLEASLADLPRHCREIRTIRFDIADLATEIVVVATVEDRHVVSAISQLTHNFTADKGGATDDERFHLPTIDLRRSFVKSTRYFRRTIGAAYHHTIQWLTCGA